MRITWLNPSLTEALVTRGWWRWKRQAMVQSVQSKSGAYDKWVFAGTDVEVDWKVRRYLNDAITEIYVKRIREAERCNWQLVSSLPEAKAVKR